MYSRLCKSPQTVVLHCRGWTTWHKRHREETGGFDHWRNNRRHEMPWWNPVSACRKEYHTRQHCPSTSFGGKHKWNQQRDSRPRFWSDGIQNGQNLRHWKDWFFQIFMMFWRITSNSHLPAVFYLQSVVDIMSSGQGCTPFVNSLFKPLEGFTLRTCWRDCSGWSCFIPLFFSLKQGGGWQTHFSYVHVAI